MVKVWKSEETMKNKEMSDGKYWLSIFEICLGITLIVLSFGRTFQTDSISLDIIFGIGGVIGCILGGYMFGKLNQNE